jgi:hypothetical protein
MEPVPEWKRPTYDLRKRRSRNEKVRLARARNEVRKLRKTRGYRVSRSLRTRSEHTFAEAKVVHGMDRARVRGKARVQVQATLTGAVQNLKRMAAYRGRRRPAGERAVPNGSTASDSTRFAASDRPRRRSIRRQSPSLHRSITR